MLEVQARDNIVYIVFEYIESDLLNFLKLAPVITQSPEVVKVGDVIRPLFFI